MEPQEAMKLVIFFIIESNKKYSLRQIKVDKLNLIEIVKSDMVNRLVMKLS